MTVIAETGIIFDVQRFSLHDGPGIRTAVFFKGCPLKCLWCQNPESLRRKPEVAFYAERCHACFKCKSACSENAIAQEPQRRIIFSKCTNCGECVEACPHLGIRRIGRIWGIEDLMRELLKDKDFFEDSGGGVTLTGGEPMLQASYLAGLLPRLKAAGIHVNMETCGMFKWERIEPVLPHLDLIYYDLKHMHAGTHKRLTRQGNQIILDNFSNLAGTFSALQARMPIIPGKNDDPENISATAQFLTRHGHHEIHCLPYHRLGEAKIPRIQSLLRPLKLKSLRSDALEHVKSAFEKKGVHAVIYD